MSDVLFSKNTSHKADSGVSSSNIHKAVSERFKK